MREQIAIPSEQTLLKPPLNKFQGNDTMQSLFKSGPLYFGELEGVSLKSRYSAREDIGQEGWWLYLSFP